MLMFITHPSDRYSIAEEVQMALEGGCKWVQLRLKDATDEEFRQTALEVIPLCKEAEAILVFDDRVNLAIEMGVHGVHLGKEDMPPREARELMGAEAIIGVTANSEADIAAVRHLDIDYVGVGPFRFTSTKKKLAPVLGIEGYERITSWAASQGIELPIVAIGGIGLDDIEPLMKAGVDGIAVSSDIINAPDPVERTRQLIEECKKHKKI